MNESNNRGYLPTLDGWRAIAIAAVIISHSQNSLNASGLGDARIILIASWGRLGVDLFFAISGFLICYRLLDERRATGRISLGAFYVRRCCRIMPLYFAYLAALGLLALVADLPVDRAEIRACVLFYRNYSTVEGTFTNHFWSLSLEEHFYLLWPFFLLAAGRSCAAWITPALALQIHIWRSMDSRWHLFAMAFPDPGLLWRTDARIDAMLWGCFAALSYHGRETIRFPGWSQWALIAALPTCIILHVPALPLIFALLFPLLILSTVTRPDSWLGRFLELRPLRWVGRLSFSLYVWQTLFLQGQAGTIPPWLRHLQQWPTNLAMIFLCSVVSHELIERPMIRLGRSLAHRCAGPTPAISAAATSSP